MLKSTILQSKPARKSSTYIMKKFFESLFASKKVIIKAALNAILDEAKRRGRLNESTCETILTTARELKIID